MKTQIGKIVVGCLAASALTACGPDEKDGEPVAVTHQSASQAIESNSTNISASFAASLEMLEASELFGAGIDMLESDGDVAVCADFNDPAACPEPAPEPEQVDLDGAVTEGTDAAVEILRDHIFVDGNIETESTTEVTYLLRGDIVCPALEGDDSAPMPVGDGGADSTLEGDVGVEDNGCVDAIDKSEIRLRVTSPVPGDIDVAVLIGPARHNPASFQFHQNLLAAELDLAGAKASIEHISDVLGEEAPELPQTMAGRVRGELMANGSNSVTWSFSILTRVDIVTDGFSLAADAASPASTLTLDGAAKRIEGSSSLGAVDISFVDETYSGYVDESGEVIEEVESHTYDIDIAGATGTVVFDVGSDKVDLTGLGLGNGTTTVAVDGAQILGIDLNANSGRTFDATVSKAASDDVLVEVSPLFDLQLGLDFQNAPEGEGDAWMHNETMTILLDGDAKPAILLGEAGLEVLRGNFSMGLANDGTLLEVSAGQCLIDTSSETVDGEPVEPVESSPFEGLEAGSCQ